ncbi:unnamed protein product [Caenorhabditis bovis]|uniref:Uncharacterized protein n=1 Tax=Caenorhabditis bovis TaxID=2654633 RepID=A0A8S1EJD8_9PELO|nr:unnamed protein product [Caenorhabditis bovis]
MSSTDSHNNESTETKFAYVVDSLSVTDASIVSNRDCKDYKPEHFVMPQIVPQQGTPQKFVNPFKSPNTTPSKSPKSTPSKSPKSTPSPYKRIRRKRGGKWRRLSVDGSGAETGDDEANNDDNMSAQNTPVKSESRKKVLDMSGSQIVEQFKEQFCNQGMSSENGATVIPQCSSLASDVVPPRRFYCTPSPWHFHLKSSGHNYLNRLTLKKIIYQRFKRKLEQKKLKNAKKLLNARKRKENTIRALRREVSAIQSNKNLHQMLSDKGRVSCDAELDSYRRILCEESIKNSRSNLSRLKMKVEKNDDTFLGTLVRSSNKEVSVQNIESKQDGQDSMELFKTTEHEANGHKKRRRKRAGRRIQKLRELAMKENNDNVVINSL